MNFHWHQHISTHALSSTDINATIGKASGDKAPDTDRAYLSFDTIHRIHGNADKSELAFLAVEIGQPHHNFSRWLGMPAAPSL
jgi:hypothetical protein